MTNTSAIKAFAESIKLRQSNAYIEFNYGSNLQCKMEIPPFQFLTSAENALSQDDPNLIDAVANAQRAVRAQIKFALDALGFATKGLKIKEQMALLEKIGMLAPRLLRKISTPRNLMEHQYRKPTSEEAEDAVDIAAMFVEATGRVVHNYEGHYHIQKKTGKTYQSVIHVDFDEEARIFEVSLFKAKNQIECLRIDSVDQLFVPLHRLAVALSRELPGQQSQAVTDAFFDLLETLGLP